MHVLVMSLSRLTMISHWVGSEGGMIIYFAPIVSIDLRI